MRAVIQAWDFEPGSNWVLEMDRATSKAERTIAVLSPAFLESRYARPEWAAAFRDDPEGDRRKLVPVRVRECQPDGLLGSIVYIDLVGVSEDDARRRLLDGLQPSPTRRRAMDGFPNAGHLPSTTTPSTAGPPIWNVPVGTRTFVGRNLLVDRLASAAAGGRGTTHVLHGLGGVGKTQLAARFARIHRDDLDVVWWVRAELDGTRESDFVALGERLGLSSAGVTMPSVAVAATKAWLERSDRWLLIFDNAPDPRSLTPYLPEGHDGTVLVTTRRPSDWRALGAAPMAVETWERHESIEFLSTRTGLPGDDAADQLADAVGDLPLALEQAAAYISQRAIPFARYLERFEQEETVVFADRPLDYAHTVETTWSLAMDALAGRGLASEILELCAFLAPDEIPRPLLQHHVEQRCEPDQDSQRLVDDAIAELLSYALISDAGDDRINVHRLVQLVARRRCDAPVERAATAVALLARRFPQGAWKVERWDDAATLRPHAIAAAAHADKVAVAKEAMAVLFRKLALYARGKGEFRLALEQTQRAIALFEDTLGPDDPQTARTLGDLSLIHEHLGDFDRARVAGDRAVEIKMRTFGDRHPETAITLGDLGNIMLDLGDAPAAREAQERVLEIYLHAYRPDDHRVGVTLSNLGNALTELGREQQALAAHDQAVTIAERNWPADHPFIAAAVANLAVTLQVSGRVPDALSRQTQALAIDEAAYGLDHAEVAITLTGLASSACLLGETERALKAQRRALAINIDVFGTAHPSVAVSHNNLGVITMQCGDRNAARSSLESAGAIAAEAYPRAHPHAATISANLDAVQRGQSDLTMLRVYRHAREDDIDPGATATGEPTSVG